MPALTLESIRGCPHCALMAELPAEAPNADVNCPRCERRLSHKRDHSREHALAYAVAGFIFCLFLASSPFLDVVFYGRHQTATLLLGPEILDQQQLWPLSIVVLLMTVLLPTVKFAMIIVVLAALKFNNPPPFIVPLFRWIIRISPWAMLEVYLLGLLVAYTRMEAMAYVKIDIAVYALVGAMLSMAAADSILDKEEVWSIMRKKGLAHDLGESLPHDMLGCRTCRQVSRVPEGSSCPRCGSVLHYRKHNSIERTWAFLIAAVVFYLPANYLPVMQITSFGKTTPYTITGGMLELQAHGLWPLAILVFIASIAIPFFKMLALGHLLLTTHRASPGNLEARTKLYRLIEFIGRWSMVDIFMISILVALMHFGQFVLIQADIGALFFAAVVIFTMFAVENFDTRLMWDNAAMNKSRVKRYE